MPSDSSQFQDSTSSPVINRPLPQNLSQQSFPLRSKGINPENSKILLNLVDGLSNYDETKQFLANVSYEILNNFRPRKFLNRSNEVIAVLNHYGYPDVEFIGCFVVPELKFPLVLVHRPQIFQFMVNPPIQSSIDRALTRSKMFDKVLKDLATSNYLPRLSHPISYIKPSFITIGKQVWNRDPTLDIRKLSDSSKRDTLLVSEISTRIEHRIGLCQERGYRYPDEDNILSPALQSQLFRIIKSIDQRNYSKALSSLREKMVPEVFDTFWQQGPCYSEDFAFAMSKPDSSLQLRRARWVTAFPSFRELVNEPEMVTTLDSGKPMIPTIAKYYGVSSGLIKRIKQLGEHTPAELGVTSGWALTKILARCNVNHIPNFSADTGSDIAPFLAVAKATTTFVDSLGLPQRLAVEVSSQLLKNVKGNWSQVSNSIGTTDLTDIKDFVESYADRSVLAGISHDADWANILLAKDFHGGTLNPRELYLQVSEYLNKDSLIALSRALLLLGLGDSWHIGTLVDSSNRWHKSFHNDQEKGFKHKFVSWPALCPEILAPNGCHLVPLTSSAELREEGVAMHHCVGGYVLNCQQKGSHIFSIRDQSGQRLSTLELRRGDSLEIIQNKGRQNSRPAPMAQVAAKWLLEEIKHKRIEIDWKHLEKARLKAIQTSGIEDLLGFNPSDNLSWFRAFSEFSAFAPSNLRSSDPKKFISKLISKIDAKQFPFQKMELEIISSLK